MTTRPTDDPLFCTTGTRITPSSTLRANGLAGGKGLGAEHLNELFGVQGDWIKHLTESISAEYDFGPDAGWLVTSATATLTAPDGFVTTDGFWAPATTTAANLWLPFPRDYYEADALIKVVDEMTVWGQFADAADEMSYVFCKRNITTGVVSQVKAATTINGTGKGTGAIFSDTDNAYSYQMEQNHTYGLAVQLNADTTPGTLLFLGARIKLTRSRTQ